MQPSAMRRARSVSFPIPVRIDSAEAPLVKHPGVWARKANLVIQHRIFYSIIDGPLFLKSELQSSWMGFQGNLRKMRPAESGAPGGDGGRTGNIGPWKSTISGCT